METPYDNIRYSFNIQVVKRKQAKSLMEKNVCGLLRSNHAGLTKKES